MNASLKLEIFEEKFKVHRVYQLKSGIKVPSVTTILSILDKPALIHWAWKLGMAQIDYRKVRDNAASIGTIAHYMAECYIKNEVPQLGDYSPNDILKAKVSFDAFISFVQNYNLQVIFSEEYWVSEKYLYGGTLDIYGDIRGKRALLDLKTSSGIYPEMRLQLAAYKNLLQEQGNLVDEIHLLRLDKETGEFHHYELGGLEKEWEMFKELIKVYKMKQEIWGSDKYSKSKV